MKKRLLSALLALALVFVLLPTTALADTTPVTDENVKINGTAVTVGNDISLGAGNGTYSYDKSTRTLTLNNATITATGSNIGIDFCDTTNYVTYSVILTGENTVTSNNIAIETTPNTNLTFTGGGNLKAITNGYYQAIRVYGTLTIENSTLIAESSAYTATTVIWTLAMTGDKAKLEISNKSAANIVAGTAGPASNIDWSNYQFTTGSYSGDALTESDPEVCSWGTLKKYFGYPTKEYSQYICIAKRTIALETTSDVRIAGGPAVVGQKTSLGEGKGYYTYDATTHTLTLENVNITSGTNAIQFTAAGTYTVKLEGTNEMSGVSKGILAANVAKDAINVIISGSGSLDISAKGRAIEVSGNLTFNNTGTINLKTTNTADDKINAIKVSGDISIGNDFNKNLKITTDNGDFMLGVSDLNSLNKCKTITIASKPSETYYNGTAMKYGETKTVGNGTISCDENGVITLNGVTEGTLVFNSSSDSTLVLEGTNTLSSIVTTQKGLTISGSGSLTAGSIRVPNNTQHTANLTINGGAHVTVNRPSSEDEPAVEVSGNLTVTGDGTQLSAECTAATNPAIEVGGNVTISGNPGTNAYTVKAHNKYATQRGRDDNLRPSQMPSAIEISGDSLSISNSARVMAKTDSDGAAVWMPKQKVISVVDASLIAQNSSHNFSTISFGDESNMGNIYAKGQEVNIVAENMLHSSSSLAHRAIKAYIYNHYNTGDSNPYYIKVVSEGVQSGGNVNVIPGHCTSTGGYKVTITRGDAYSAPTTISKIIITGLTPPVKGATPVDKSKVTLTDGLTVESITWGPALTSDGKFAANTAYTAHINYSVKAGYELAAKANCPQVDGANVTRWHQEGMPQDEIEVTFPKTAADTPTEKPTITLDLPAPVAGVAPVTTGVTATSSDNTPLTIDKVEWYAYTVEYNKTDGNFDRIVKGNKVSGNFEANTYYLAEITFDKSISFANGGLNITAPTWPLEGSWPESCIYRVIENSYTARILFPATDAACNHQPGDWQDGTDGEHHVKVCAICHNVVATESHAFGGYQINTNNSHTRVCSVCNAAYTNAHEFNSYAHNENSHWKVCVCGATTSYANHEFDPATGACACGATQSGGNPTPDVPAAPTGLAGVAPTSANSKDGKITGTTAAMEYATEPNGSNWIECGGDEVTGLSAGTYYVRYKRTTDKPASAVATVVVPAYSGGGEIVPPTPDNPGTIVIIRPAEEEKPAQQPNPSTGANDLVGLAVAAAVAAALGSAALLRKHD